MHRENENQSDLAQVEYKDSRLSPRLGPDAKAAPVRSSRVFRTVKRVKSRPGNETFPAELQDALSWDASETKKLLRFYTSELNSLLRYATFLPYGVVERWSRKIKEIDTSVPPRGLAILDELLGDYWSVFVATRLAVVRESGSSGEPLEFEIEMRKLKAGFDSLGAVLMAVEFPPRGDE
jgi:hypothetical protein